MSGSRYSVLLRLSVSRSWILGMVISGRLSMVRSRVRWEPGSRWVSSLNIASSARASTAHYKLIINISRQGRRGSTSISRHQQPSRKNLHKQYFICIHPEHLMAVTNILMSKKRLFLRNKLTIYRQKEKSKVTFKFRECSCIISKRQILFPNVIIYKFWNLNKLSFYH